MDSWDRLPVEPELSLVRWCKADEGDAHVCPVNGPLFITPGFVDRRILPNAIEHRTACAFSNGLRCNEASALDTSGCYLFACPLEPVADKLHAAGKPSIISRPHLCRVVFAERPDHCLIAEERRIADDCICLWPRRGSTLPRQHGVPALDRLK